MISIKKIIITLLFSICFILTIGYSNPINKGSDKSISVDYVNNNELSQDPVWIFTEKGEYTRQISFQCVPATSDINNYKPELKVLNKNPTSTSVNNINQNTASSCVGSILISQKPDDNIQIKEIESSAGGVCQNTGNNFTCPINIPVEGQFTLSFVINAEKASDKPNSSLINSLGNFYMPSFFVSLYYLNLDQDLYVNQTPALLFHDQNDSISLLVLNTSDNEIRNINVKDDLSGLADTVNLNIGSSDLCQLDNYSLNCDIDLLAPREGLYIDIPTKASLKDPNKAAWTNTIITSQHGEEPNPKRHPDGVIIVGSGGLVGTSSLPKSIISGKSYSDTISVMASSSYASTIKSVTFKRSYGDLINISSYEPSEATTCKIIENNHGIECTATAEQAIILGGASVAVKVSALSKGTSNGSLEWFGEAFPEVGYDIKTEIT